MGKLKDMRKLKPAKNHELSAQVAAEPWMQQQYAAPYQQTYYNPSSQSEITEGAFHQMQINSYLQQTRIQQAYLAIVDINMTQCTGTSV